MCDILDRAFLAEGIEYYSAIVFENTRVINERLLAKAPFSPRAAIIFLVPYYSGKAENLSVYSASKDYHLFLKELNSKIISALSRAYPTARFLGYGDHSPIDERHAALISGLGIIGKNGLLINEKYGSFVFISDILTDLEPSKLGASDPKPISSCKACGRCLQACPTGILCGKSEICLSALTQKKGELSEEEKRIILSSGSVWGCDECQLSCPYNRDPVLTPIEFFKEDRTPHLTLDILDSMSEEEFSERAYAWRGRKTIRRNLLLFESEKSNKCDP